MGKLMRDERDPYLMIRDNSPDLAAAHWRADRKYIEKLEGLTDAGLRAACIEQEALIAKLQARIADLTDEPQTDGTETSP